VTPELMSDEDEITDDSGHQVFAVLTVLWRDRQVEELVHKLMQLARKVKRDQSRDAPTQLPQRTDHGGFLHPALNTDISIHRQTGLSVTNNVL
jgi:hypothetical protein